MTYSPSTVEIAFIMSIIFGFVTAGLLSGIAYNFGKASVDNQAHANNALYITTIVFMFLSCILATFTGFAILNQSGRTIGLSTEPIVVTTKNY